MWPLGEFRAGFSIGIAFELGGAVVSKEPSVSVITAANGGARLASLSLSLCAKALLSRAYLRPSAFISPSARIVASSALRGRPLGSFGHLTCDLLRA